MPIAKKLWLTVGVLVSLLIVSGLISYHNIQRINADVVRIAEVEEPLNEAVLEMEINAGEAARAVLEYVRDMDSKHLDKAQDSEADFEKHYADFKRLAETEEERWLGQKVADLFAEFKRVGDEIIALAEQRGAVLGRFRKDVEEIDELLDRNLQENIDRTSPGGARKVEAALEIEINAHEAFASIQAYVFRPNSALRKKAADSERDFAKFLKSYRKTKLSANEKKRLEKVEGSYGETVRLGYQIMDGTDALNDRLERFEDLLERMDAILDEQVQPLVHRETVRAQDDAKASGRTAVFSIFILAFVAITAGAGSAWALSRGIVRPIRELQRGVEIVGRGNLGHMIHLKNKDELGELAGSFNEMTKNLRASEELVRKNENQLRSIVDDNVAAIYVTDRARRVTKWSQGAEDLYGYAESEVIGQYVGDIIIPDDRKEKWFATRELVIESISRKGSLSDQEVIHRKKDGTLVPVGSTRSPVHNEDGEVTEIWAVIKDLTEHKQAEEKLLHALEEAEAASRAKSEFLSTVSHELRSPLNAVIGFSDLLMRDVKDEMTQQLAPKIRDSGKYLLAMIEEILDLERIASGKILLKFEPASINDLVSGVVSSWHPRLPEKFSMSLEIDPSCGAVLCDFTRISQILNNLIDNAVKYSPDGGAIHVQTKSTDDEVCVSVSDEGVGIRPGEKEAIFNRFQQLESGYTRRAGGLGIGLALARELIEMHGGRIWVDSEDKKGSTFFIALPRNRATARKASRQDGDPDELMCDGNPWEGRTILVVDDIEHYHEYIRILMNNAARLVSAYNGEEAIEAARRENPDLILMDLRMPVMDGFDATRRLKSDPETKDIPIIAVTAQAMEEDRMRSLEAGADGYVTKPVDIEELSKEVGRVLGAQMENHPAEMITRHTLAEERTEEAPSPGGSLLRNNVRVLVAEDNTVNQMLTKMMLEKLGCTVDMASNGREAVEMLGLTPYNLVIMDCSMPEMDGFEATQEIRRREEVQDHIPIIAMTALVMEGDRERCLEAGMDDYISKPVDLDELRGKLHMWLEEFFNKNGVPEKNTETDDLSEVNPSNIDDGPINRNDFNQLLALDTEPGSEFVDELVDVFLRESPAYISDIRKTLDHEDASSLQKIAHTVKSSSSSIGARKMMEICANLEKQGAKNDLEGADELLKKLEVEYSRVKEELTRKPWKV